MNRRRYVLVRLDPPMRRKRTVALWRKEAARVPAGPGWTVISEPMTYHEGQKALRVATACPCVGEAA